MMECEHEWAVEGPGVHFRQLLIICNICDATGEATIAYIDYGDDDDE